MENLSSIWPLFPLAFAKSVPLILAATGGLYSERTGVVNIGLEGMMLSGALAGIIGTYYSHNPWIGLAAAIAAGIILALILAVTSVSLGINQIVSGIAVNILAIGLTGGLLFKIFGGYGSSPSVEKLPQVSLHPIPLLSELLGNQSILFYFAVILVIVTFFLINNTRLGLRMRAAGEDPGVAASCGINVFRIRYFGVLMSGALSGMAGAYLSLADLSQFVERMTAGRGFIALAVLILGRWKPFNILLVCLFFGLAEALAEFLQGIELTIPAQFLLMLPFILTLFVMGGLIGETKPPACLGKSYQAE
ncbi:MAG: ABC transporter permease [Candidatus Schekmanbacteria bacterium]|nr:ABC transporter permease [Candidatus Schekmanbacteria bacterium]